ncbi:MAG: hypothetical protein M3313_10000 [Actinomycetota bacterium]|nr:hypothetical protein [Actinomycetota bacterium]
MKSANRPNTQRNRDQEGSVAMNSIANDVARARIRDLRADARAGSRARRLIAAQRWQRRAERAARRAQLARNSIW